MSESYSNKPILILKTSFSVSIIFAASLGVIFSLYRGNSFSQFLYLTYIFFVNNLLMPVSIAAIVYYFLSKNDGQKNWISSLKIIGIMSFVSLVLLFIWNIMDFFFHYHLHLNPRSEFIWEHLQDQLLLGTILAVPVSLLIIFFYNLMDSKSQN